MLRTILVPLDGSRFGEHALPTAVSLARGLGAGLRLVHVHVPLLDAIEVLDTSLEEQTRVEEQNYLDSTLKRLTLPPTAAGSTHLLEGPIVAALQEEAAQTKADLVVMTTHGRGRFVRFWLGSVADELVRHLTTPVLLLRPADHPPDLTEVAGFQRMVIALDGSPLSEAVLASATIVAEAMKPEVHLVRVIDPPVTVEYRGFGQVEYASAPMLEQLRELHERDKTESADYLSRLAKQLTSRGLKVVTHVAIHDQPAQAILGYVTDHKADLVALATHGRGGLTRLLLGSVADKVVRGAHCAVLVYRPAEKT